MDKATVEAPLVSASDIEVDELLVEGRMGWRKMVNLDAHDGLRGIAACWVMVFHCFRAYRGSDIDFQGSSIMPLFFLLSGFTLSVVYDNIAPTLDEVSSGRLEMRKGSTFWTFYFNRLVRVVPVYYLLSILAVPCWFYGYGDVDPKTSFVGPIVTTMTFTSTLFIFLFGGCLDGPGWTVQTFLWMWIGFPKMSQRARNMTNEQLGDWLVYLYYIQLISVFVICEHI
jgi:peptidoglycan/LPS O-acetylase OafA/YrhL